MAETLNSRSSDFRISPLRKMANWQLPFTFHAHIIGSDDPVLRSLPFSVRSPSVHLPTVRSPPICWFSICRSPFSVRPPYFILAFLNLHESFTKAEVNRAVSFSTSLIYLQYFHGRWLPISLFINKTYRCNIWFPLSNPALLFSHFSHTMFQILIFLTTLNALIICHKICPWNFRACTSKKFPYVSRFSN